MINQGMLASEIVAGNPTLEDASLPIGAAALAYCRVEAAPESWFDDYCRLAKALEGRAKLRWSGRNGNGGCHAVVSRVAVAGDVDHSPSVRVWKFDVTPARATTPVSARGEPYAIQQLAS